jgi:hypothetical protein
LTLSRWTRIAVAVAIALAVAVVTVAAVLLVASPEPPLGERLADSLVDAAAGPGGFFVADGPCEPQGGRRWLCGIEDDPGSGASDTYLVELGRDGCWSGARTDDPPGGQPLRGCME